MNRQIAFLMAGILISILAVSCSGGDTPISPSGQQEPTQDLTAGADRAAQVGANLWGYYDFFLDIQNKKIEAVPNRSVGFSANVVKFLNNDPAGLQVKFNGTSPGTGYIDIDMDITIKHPLSDNAYDGYDVRGIFIGNGSSSLAYNSDLIVPVSGTDQMLLNADGYSRWFNPTEFLVPKIFGYIPGKVASKGYTGTATLIPYKYFCEGLSATDYCWGYLASGSPNAGYFLAGTSNTRNYIIRFPIPLPGVKYNYAVVANWSGTAPQFHPSHAPEAVAVKVDDESTLYYVDETTKGGKLILDIGVFDWDAELTGGVMEDYTVFVESTVLSSVHELDTAEMTPSSIGDHWFTYHVEIPADNVLGIDGNEMWVVVEDGTADYTNPLGVPNSADGDKIAACFRRSLTVSDVEPKGIQVTVPNGGEQWKVQGSGDITWTADGDVQNVQIKLSLNSGADYTIEISNSTPNDGTFTWDPIPLGALGDNNRVRITDMDDSSVFDESDADFSVTLPTIEVTSPNGGECWIAGYEETITWVADPAIDNVTILLSLNSGADYGAMVIDSTPNDGEFVWNNVLGDYAGSTCRIKVQDETYPIQIFDESDADFEIGLPEIQVVTPNGGEKWKVDSTHDITWTSDPVIQNVYIYLSLNGGEYYSYVLAGPIPDTGSWQWDSIIESYISSDCRIEVVSAEIPQAFDESDADFEIYDQPILLTYPNGGEIWKVGGTYDITWEADPSILNVKIEVSEDSGGSYPYTIVDSTPNDGEWLDGPLPEDAIGEWRMKISDVDNPAVYDESDGDYSIIDAWIDLTSPNGGEELPVGSDFEITWECSETGGTVYIIYTKDDFDTDFHDIAPAAPNTGSYLWTDIPNDVSGTVKVGLEFSDLFLRDSSDDYFAIGEPQPSITVTSPNGWEYLRANHDFEITWESNGVTGPVNIWYSKDDFQSDVIYIITTPNDGSVMWDPIPYDPSDTVKIKVESSDDPGINDVSNNNFHLTDSGWADVWGGANNDYGQEVATDAYGNTYVTGYLGASPTSAVAFLRKYSPAGSLVWSNTWGAEGSAIGNGVAVDTDYNIYVTGRFYGTDVDMDPGPGTALRTSDANGDIFLSRFGPSGNFSYVKTWGGYTDWCGEAGTDLLINGTDLYVTGYFTGTNVDFDPGAGSYLRSSNGGSDAFLSKFNTSGAFSWAGSWGGTDASYGDESHGMGFESGGDIVVMGRFFGTNVDFDPDAAGTTFKSSLGGSDAFMVWFDYTGDFRGVWTWGGTGYDSAESIMMGAGGYYTAGYFEGTNVDFDPGAGTDLKSSSGSSDAFLCRFNGLLVYQWARTWGGTSYDTAMGLTTDDYPVVTGYYSSEVDFDPGTGTDLHTSNGGYDAYWSNFDPDGGFLGAGTWGGSENDLGCAICRSDDYRIFIAGAMSSSLVEFAPTGAPCFDDSDIHSTTGGSDAFLVKYMPDGCW